MPKRNFMILQYMGGQKTRVFNCQVVLVFTMSSNFIESCEHLVFMVVEPY